MQIRLKLLDPFSLTVEHLLIQLFAFDLSRSYGLGNF